MLYLTTKPWLIGAVTAILFGVQMECAKDHQEEPSLADLQGLFVKPAKKLDL
jgi:hypothetical protein